MKASPKIKKGISKSSILSKLLLKKPIKGGSAKPAKKVSKPLPKPIKKNPPSVKKTRKPATKPKHALKKKVTKPSNNIKKKTAKPVKKPVPKKAAKKPVEQKPIVLPPVKFPVGMKTEAISLARNVVGETAVLVVNFLNNKRDISEFEISKRLRMEVNHARSILYKLFNHNLVAYIRRKDKIKGWYISYWTLHPSGFVELKEKLRRQKLRDLKDRLEREENNPNGFFLCKNACVRADIDQATEYGFRCPECGALLVPQDNSKTIENLRTRIKELEAEI